MMARRRITQELYDCMLDGFRKYPQESKKVHEYIINDPRSGGIISLPTIQKAYYKGWPKYDMPPIKDILEQETLDARRVANRLAAQEDRLLLGIDVPPEDDLDNRERIRQDAIIARAAEAKIVKESRKNVIELLTSSKELLEGFTHLAKEVNVYLKTATVDSIEDARTAGNLLWRLATTSKSATEAGMRVLQMERLLLGQPMEIIGTKDLEEISDEEALRELEEAAACAQRIRRRRESEFHITGILSGNTKPIDDENKESN